jgi:hypothetical protein
MLRDYSYCQGCRMCERWSSLVLKVIEQVLQGNTRDFEAILKLLLFLFEDVGGVEA